MTFLQIILQDFFLASSGLFVIILIGAIYLYSFFNTSHSTSNLPPVIVDDKNFTKPFIKNEKNIQTQQQSASFHPDLIPDNIKKTGLITYLRKKHENGQRVVTDLLSINTISVIDPMAIRSSFHIGDRSENKYRFLEPIWGQDNLYVLSADRAKIYRNLFVPALSVDVIADKFYDIRNFGIEIVDKWEKGILTKNENVIRIQDQGLEFSLKTTIKALFSADFPKNFDLVEYKKIYHDVINRLYNREFGLISDVRDERIQNSIDYLFQILRILLNKKRQSANNNKLLKRRTQKRDLLDILISEKDPETNQNFDDEKIQNIMSLFLTIGFLSTGISIAWVVFCIAKSSKVQEKIQNEIDRLLKGRLPSYHDLLNLTYLNQVIKESLIKRPPFPVLSRYLAKNENLETMGGQLNLQKDTVLLYPITLSEDADCPLDIHCPFGFGNRICPAENMAMIEIQLMTCLIVQKFKVKSCIPDIKVSGEENIISMARNDIYIELIPRCDISK